MQAGLLLLCSLLVLPTAGAVDRKILVRVKPQYPPIAKRLKLTGTVMLTVVVEPSGVVKEVNTIMGEKILVEAARQAVKQWKFVSTSAQTFEDVELEFPVDAAP